MKLNKENYEKWCAKWCDKHGISKLSSETMDRCFCIPRDGVPVSFWHSDVTYVPINENSGKDVLAAKLGTYGVKEGVVCFVYRDGHVYVAKGLSIIAELQAAGYKDEGMFVPFVNGEKITAPHLAAAWSITPER